MNIDQQNERDYEQWLKQQGISRAEHGRRVMRLVHENPGMHQHHLQLLKEKLQAKHKNNGKRQKS